MTTKSLLSLSISALCVSAIDCLWSLLRADVAVDEDNGRIFGVGKAYSSDLGISGTLNVRAFNENGDTLWNFEERGRNPSVVMLARLVGLLLLLSVFW